MSISDLYEKVLSNTVSKIRDGQNDWCGRKILEIEREYYQLGSGQRLSEEARSSRAKFFIAETIKGLQSLPYDLVTKLLEIKEAPLFHAVTILCQSEQKLRSIDADEFANVTEKSDLIGARHIGTLFRPLLVIRLLLAEPKIWDKFEAEYWNSMHCLFSVPSNKRIGTMIGKADIDIAQLVLESVDQDDIQKLSNISRFVEDAPSVKVTSKYRLMFDKFMLASNVCLDYTDYTRSNDSVLDEIEGLFEGIEFKRRILTALSIILMRRSFIFYANGMRGVKYLTDKRSRFRLNTVQFTLIRQLIDRFTVNQLLKSWEDHRGEKDFVPKTFLSEQRRFKARLGLLPDTLEVIDYNDTKRTFTRESQFLNSSNYYLVALWAMNKFVTNAQDLIKE